MKLEKACNLTKGIAEAEETKREARIKPKYFTRIRKMSFSELDVYKRQAMNCPELWKDGEPTLNLHLGISAQNAVQMFWPWQEDQLTQVFCSAPEAQFEVEAWDVYHNGKYLYTEYNVRGT